MIPNDDSTVGRTEVAFVAVLIRRECVQKIQY